MSTIRGAIFALIAKFVEWRKTNPKLSMFAILITLAWVYHRTKKYIRGKRSLKNKIVLITGGVSGIGRETALLLKRMNAIVIVWDINKTGLQEMREFVDMALFVDITQRSKVEEAARAVLDQYENGIDILINNAGIVIGKPILELTEGQIRKCFDVNIMSHFWTIKAFLPKMIEKQNTDWCHIVSISSSAGRMGVQQLTDYCATKYAVRGLTDSIKAEMNDMGLTNIGVTTIMPYLVNTGMFDGAVASKSIVMRLCGCYFLEQDYVAAQIVRAIQYDIRNVILPKELSMICSWEHSLPNELKDYLLSIGPSFHQLMGRKGKKQTNN
eukprot:210949_1